MAIHCPACLSENPDGQVTCLVCGFSLTPDQSTNTATTVAYHLPTGTQLKQGKYKIEKLLGEGGFGITYKGLLCQKEPTTIAIKELWPEKSARQGSNIIWPTSIPPKERQQQLKKFQLEASFLKKCKHPNISQVYDWFEENNTAYLVMEFVAGKSLYQLLKDKGSLPENDIKKYFIQISEALKIVHSNKLLHRDIKPDNILIDDGTDRAVLIDFGATKEFIAGQTREMSTTLTPGYAPLEQYSYRGKRWPATDIYALCASMYEMLTGQLPLPAVDRASSDDLVAPRQLAPKISDLMEKVILTGMQFKVEDRFQTADELIQALNGHFISPPLRKARELMHQGKKAASISAYESCLDKEPDNGLAAVELALVQIHENDAQADSAAQRAIQLQPNDGRGHGVLGLVCCRQGRWPEALQHLQQAAKLAPEQAWIQANLAWAWGKTGQWQRAKSAAKNAIQQDPDCIFALGLKSWIAIHQMEWKSAIQAARQAIFKSKQDPSSASKSLQHWVYPHLLMALEQATADTSQDVARCLQEFMTQVPDSTFAWGYHGWQNAKQSQWSKALESFETATQKNNDLAWVFLDQGITLEYLDQPQQAIQTYEAYNQSLEMDALGVFRLGTVLAQTGQWEQALSYLEKAVQLEPNYAEAHHNLGWALLNLQTRDSQHSHFRKLLAAYRRAIDLYTEQQQLSRAQAIRQAFQDAGVPV